MEFITLKNQPLKLISNLFPLENIQPKKSKIL